MRSSNDVDAIIRQRLKNIEVDRDVKILFAVEAGSRAWGFESPDSDWDVRFVYVHPVSYYLRLEESKDTIECIVDYEFDLVGWDLSKVLKLLGKSNMAIFEWVTSPIVYHNTKEWEGLCCGFGDFFQKLNAAKHYYHMAMGNRREFVNDEEVSIKKYLYVLRTILACKWVLSEGTVPPIRFVDLIHLVDDLEVLSEIQKLLVLKSNSVEIGNVKRVDILDSFFINMLCDLGYEIKVLEANTAEGMNAKNIAWEKLNGMFLNTLKCEREKYGLHV